MKIFGLGINKVRIQPIEPMEHIHTLGRCVDLDDGIYLCSSCDKSCIFIDKKLTELTMENRSQNDKGKTINGIYQF